MSSFAIADLHGCYDLWHQVQSFCKDSDCIYVLGDCIDRGPQSLDTLKSVLNDPRTIMLCGNHEDMMMETLKEEIQYGESDYWTWRWFSNGGRPTYDDWQQEGMDFNWISILQNLPLWAKYTNQNGENIIMTHSGVAPKAGWDISSCSRQTLLWDRNSIKATRWHRDENEIIVHGHTPIVLMTQFKNKDVEVEPGAFWYCDGHRCNLDTGTAWTGSTCLLNLDTWEEHIFNG